MNRDEQKYVSISNEPDIKQALTLNSEENTSNEIENLNNDTITKDRMANSEIDVKFDQKKEVDTQISQSISLEYFIYDVLIPTNKERLIDFIKFINKNPVNCKFSFPIHVI